MAASARVLAAMNGARLAYVVRKLEGKVSREVVTFDRVPAGKDGKGNERVMHAMKRQPKMVDAGYMVYFPRGHCLRLTEKQLKQYNLNTRPKIINLEGLNDPNSPVGQLIMEQDEEGRSLAYKNLEKAVIDIVTATAGAVQMPEQLRRRQELEQPTDKKKAAA